MIDKQRLLEYAAVAAGTVLICFTYDALNPPIIPPVTGTDYGGYRPHYQGHGTKTKGGRGGQVIRVSNAQQLRDAVAVNGPRIIVFDASGNYDLGGQLAVTNPFLTIAGQTAPDPGVTLVNTRFLIDTNDVVVQHVRVRLPPRSLNACSIGDAGDGGDNSHIFNIVYDHVTCTWSNEVNNLLVAGPGSHDVSILDSFVAEGLWSDASGGIGVGITSNQTFARNVISNHWSRQPVWGSPAGTARPELAIYNNITYNGYDNSEGYAALPTFYGDLDGEGNAPGKIETVVMNNLIIPGPNSGGAHAILGFSKKKGSVDAGSKTYLAGNQGPGIPDANADQWNATVCTGSYGTYPNAATCGPNSNMRTNTIFPWFTAFNFVVMPTNDLFVKVLANAGARPKNRDSADNKLIADIQNGTGTVYLSAPSTPMPQLQVNSRPCVLPTDPNGANGTRTNMDVYLESDSICGAQRLEVR